MRPQHLLPAATGLLLALTLTACGGGGSSAGSSDDSSQGSGPVSSAPSTSSTTSATPADVCKSVTAADMSAALQETVSEQSEAIGCGYAPTDPDGPEVSLEQKAVSDYAGGFDTAKDSLASVVKDGKGSSVDAGDQAYLVVGQDLTGSSTTGLGMVQIGNAIVQVNLRQEKGMSADQVTSLLTAAMKVVGAAS